MLLPFNFLQIPVKPFLLDLAALFWDEFIKCTAQPCWSSCSFRIQSQFCKDRHSDFLQLQVFQQDDTNVESQDKFSPHIRDLYRFICKEHVQALQSFVPQMFSVIILGGELTSPTDVLG